MQLAMEFAFQPLRLMTPTLNVRAGVFLCPERRPLMNKRMRRFLFAAWVSICLVLWFLLIYREF